MQAEYREFESRPPLHLDLNLEAFLEMRGFCCFLPLIYPLRGYFDGFVSTLSRITAELAGVDTTADTPPTPLLQGDVGVGALRYEAHNAISHLAYR